MLFTGLERPTCHSVQPRVRLQVWSLAAPQPRRPPLLVDCWRPVFHQLGRQLVTAEANLQLVDLRTYLNEQNGRTADTDKTAMHEDLPSGQACGCLQPIEWL